MATGPRFVRKSFLLALVVGGALVGAVALASEWSAVKLRGTVLSLDGTQWSEVEHGVVLPPNAAIRTLQSGRLELNDGGATISIGPNTAFEIFSGRDASTLLKQYSGNVTIEMGAGGGGAFRLEALDLVVVPTSGKVVVEISNKVAEVKVEGGGSASITDRRDGQVAEIAAGQTFVSSSSGVIVAGADLGGAPGGSQPGSSDGGSSPNASSGDVSSSASSSGASSSGASSSGGAGSSGASSGGSSSNASGSSASSSSSSASSSGGSSGNASSSGGASSNASSSGASSSGDASSGGAGSSGNASSSGAGSSGNASSGGGGASSGGAEEGG